MVFNKGDLYRDKYFDDLLEDEVKGEILTETQERLSNTYEHDNIFVSAIKKENISELRAKMKEMIEAQYQIRYPYQTKTW